MHPEIPEGINVSKTHPLADFGLMLAGALGIIVVLFIAAHFLAGFMVRFISFEVETALFEQSPLTSLAADPDEYAEQTAYLQDLGDRLAQHMDLPEGMQVHIHYNPEDVPNAFATLGGHILIYQGLINKVSSENGLAMVVAHEIAHVKHRDPIMALGRGTVSMIGLMLLTGFGDSSALQNVAGVAGLGVLSNFSRSQEKRADETSVAAVLATYGTLAGADEFFSAVVDEHRYQELDFFSTHPPTQDRIDRIRSQAGEPDNGDLSLTDLPDFLLSPQVSDRLEPAGTNND